MEYNHPAYYDETPLTKAVLGNKTDTLISLLEDPSVPINKTNRFGRTPILLAAREGRLSMVTELTRKGADINKCDNYGNAPLHMAAIYNHGDTAKELIDSGAHINDRNNYGRTPLYLAAENLSLWAADVFLENGCDANIRCNELKTPLMAIVSQDLMFEMYEKILNSQIIASINSLLLHGALIDEKDEKGNTALHHAIHANNIYLVICLLHHGANATLVNQSDVNPFTLAIDGRQYDAAFYMSLYFTVKYLLGCSSANCTSATDRAAKIFLKIASDASFDIAAQYARDSLCSSIFDITEYNTLARLITAGNDGKPLDTKRFKLSKIRSLQQICRILILDRLRIAPVSAINLLPIATKMKQFLLYGYTPNINPMDVANIHLACIEGDDKDEHAQICEKRDVLQVPLKGTTVIEKAVFYGRHRLVQDILESNHDVCLESNVIHLACKRGNESMFSLFLSRNIDPNLADENGDMPIYVAARHGQWNIVQLLISKTRDIGQKDNYGKHVIHYASASGDYDTVEMLLNAMPNLNSIRDGHGYTPLHLSASCGFLYLERNIPLPSMFNSDIAMDALIIKLVHSVDKRGVSCSMFKDEVCHTDVVRMLISSGSDVNVKCDIGTPQMVAMNFGHDNILQELENV